MAKRVAGGRRGSERRAVGRHHGEMRPGVRKPCPAHRGSGASFMPWQEHAKKEPQERLLSPGEKQEGAPSTARVGYIWLHRYPLRKCGEGRCKALPSEVVKPPRTMSLRETDWGMMANSTTERPLQRGGNLRAESGPRATGDAECWVMAEGVGTQRRDPNEAARSQQNTAKPTELMVWKHSPTYISVEGAHLHFYFGLSEFPL